MSERKAIFITGGGSGIGRAVALYFGQRGWFVGLGDIDKAGMRETEDMIGNGFGYGHLLDVRDRAAWDEALEAFSVAAGGRIDVVFNNAGIPLGGSLLENSAEEIERCLDINLKGVLFGAQAAHSYLKKTAPGSCLLNTASAAGIYGTPGASVYSATKFGVRAVTESLDGEWAEDGINVRSLMPSFIDTPLLDHNVIARDNCRCNALCMLPCVVHSYDCCHFISAHKREIHCTECTSKLTRAVRRRLVRRRRRKFS